MNALDITTCYGIAMSASAIFCGMRWLRAERQAVRLADNNAYWQHRAGILHMTLDMERKLAIRRERRPARSQASSKGWRTRREKAA